MKAEMKWIENWVLNVVDMPIIIMQWLIELPIVIIEPYQNYMVIIVVFYSSGNKTAFSVMASGMDLMVKYIQHIRCGEFQSSAPFRYKWKNKMTKIQKEKKKTCNNYNTYVLLKWLYKRQTTVHEEWNRAYTGTHKTRSQNNGYGFTK